MKIKPLTYFRKNILPYIIAYSAKWLTKAIFFTCKKEVVGVDAFKETATKDPCILMLWHNDLIITPEILYKYAPNFIYTAFISKSRDGNPLAILAESYKAGRALRVPHNQRHAALHALIGKLKEGKEIVIITPDGPRGPKHVMKPGVVVAAQASGASIVPLSWSAKNFWELNTWDAMKIPKPFTTIYIKFGPSVNLDKHITEAEALEILTRDWT